MAIPIPPKRNGNLPHNFKGKSDRTITSNDTRGDHSLDPAAHPSCIPCLCANCFTLGGAAALTMNLLVKLVGKPSHLFRPGNSAHILIDFVARASKYTILKVENIIAYDCVEIAQVNSSHPY